MESLKEVREPTPARAGGTLANILLEQGAVDPDDLVIMLARQNSVGGDLGGLLTAHGLVSQHRLAAAYACLHNTHVFSRDHCPPPDPGLVDHLGTRRCLALHCMPWQRVGDVTVIATPHPERFAENRAELEACFGTVAMVVVTQDDFRELMVELRGRRMAQWAELCVRRDESCRMLQNRHFSVGLKSAAIALLLVAVLAPVKTLFVVTFLTAAVLALVTCLKALAVFATLRKGPRAVEQVARTRPVVSIMVPLFREPRVVPRLIQRLSRLTWPRDCLDIMLVVEEKDSATRDALALAPLPTWMRVIVVPDGPLKTKPRALNYALLFARGSIIGVYDAEDAPAPDQIHRIVACFEAGPPTLACVQGVLDFYNARANWLTRCFTIEYATWFRVVLPGLQRLGLVVPLGGTTLFFRRHILEELGGWDAHNVTEDADLGIRLARYGYYTELLDTVTLEEATSRPLPWIKQRSRWLKGYAVTWIVHMRDPRRLWRDLGTKRFIGVQLLFLGTLIQFTFAPLLWSFWLIVFSLPHPIGGLLTEPIVLGFMAVFLLSELVSMAAGFLALRATEHRSLRAWLPSLHGYFPLAVLAVYKALWELVYAPFYWDKTAHGFHLAESDQIEVMQA